MKLLAGTFDSIGYVGIGRQALTRCIAAFEAEDKERAITEFRQTVGRAPNFASALTDLDADKLPTEVQGRIFTQMLGVMMGMELLTEGYDKEVV